MPTLWRANPDRQITIPVGHELGCPMRRGPAAAIKRVGVCWLCWTGVHKRILPLHPRNSRERRMCCPKMLPCLILSFFGRVLHVAAYTTRNWTMGEEISRKQISDLWEASRMERSRSETTVAVPRAEARRSFGITRMPLVTSARFAERNRRGREGNRGGQRQS